MFPIFYENPLFDDICKNSMFAGHKPTAVTYFMHPKILDYILEDLSLIVLIK